MDWGNKRRDRQQGAFIAAESTALSENGRVELPTPEMGSRRVSVTIYDCNKLFGMLRMQEKGAPKSTS